MFLDVKPTQLGPIDKAVYLKTETESSPRNVVFLNIKIGRWIMSRNIIFVIKITLLFEMGFLMFLSSVTNKQNAVSTVENELQ
jgi:hypothetical protein